MTTKPVEKKIVEEEKLICGIVMPISEIDGCTEAHWQEVFAIVNQSIDKAGFNANLVSNSDEVGVIQKRIIQNLYNNPLVVCDVSGKNPNVMFELGIRLAFDKPTIIIKDDKTQYSFDTSPIEHLEYPRDLRFSKIVEFKERLSEKIIQTYKKSKSDENFSTFLKHFGSFKIAKIETEVVSKEDFILEEIKNLREVVLRNNKNTLLSTRSERNYKQQYLFEENDNTIVVCIRDQKMSDLETIAKKIKSLRGVSFAEIEEYNSEHSHIEINLLGNVKKDILIGRIENICNGIENYIK